MSKFAYWKVSAVYLFVTIVSNLDSIILLSATCSGGAGGHCGG